MTADNDCEKCPNRITLKEMFERELKHLREQTELNFRLLETASQKAAMQLDERLSRMNEFREAMKDQSTAFITKTDMKVIDSSVRDFREFMAEHRGKASMSSVYGSWFMSVIALLLALITLVVSFR